MEFEDILKNVGSFGRHQKMMVITYVIPTAMALAVMYMSNFFILSVPEHWCYVPEIESLNLTLEQEQEIPEQDIRTSCSVLDLNYTALLPSDDIWKNPGNANIVECTKWSYDKTHYEFTAVSQWNMVCKDSHYVSFVFIMLSVGWFLGDPLGGYISDRFGRKLAFFLFVLVTAVFSAASAFMKNFSAFVILRTIGQCFSGGIYQASYVLTLEIVGPDMRTRVNGIYCLFWGIGSCLMPLVAWISRDWIKMCLVSSVLVFSLLLYYPFLHESAQWLLSVKKYDEAAKELYYIAGKNGKVVNLAEISNQIKELGRRSELKKKTEIKRESPFFFLKVPQLRNIFFIISFCSVTCLCTFDGLLLNGQNLVGNEFLNMFLLVAIEAPGCIAAWMSMQKIGRRWCSVFYFTVLGLACLAPVIHSKAGLAASIVARLCSSAAYMLLYQQSPELYPTSIRVFCIGLNATIASAATFAVPYVTYLHKYGEYIPFLVFAIMSLGAAFCASFLPETLDRNLPQTSEDVVELVSAQKYFSLNRERRLHGAETASATTSYL